MELYNISNTTTWNDAVSRINSNTRKIGNELDKLRVATYKNKGYFASAEALASAHPTGSAGSIAYVGNAYPYAIYAWNTATNSWANTGYTGGDDGVVLGDYYTQEEADATFVDHNELNNTLSGYYTKATADSTFVTPTEMGEALENVYTKTEAETKFVSHGELASELDSYVTKDGLSVALGGSYSKAEADAKFVDDNELSIRLESYYTKSDAVKDLATKEELENYYTKTEAETKFATETSVTNKLSGYYTKSQADSSFVSPTELSSSLANHYTKTEADSRFIDSAELEGRIGDLATDLELSNAVSSLEDKIEKAEAKLGNYYTKAETHEAIKDEYEVLSQTAYESLVSKEEKLYFCYEEDE